MAVPDTITKALTALDTDSEGLAAVKADLEDKAQKSLDAAHAEAVATSAVTSAVSQRDKDRDALVKLITETYK